MPNLKDSSLRNKRLTLLDNKVRDNRRRLGDTKLRIISKKPYNLEGRLTFSTVRRSTTISSSITTKHHSVSLSIIVNLHISTQPIIIN